MSIATPQAIPPGQKVNAPSLTSEPAWEVAKLFPDQGRWSEDDYWRWADLVMEVVSDEYRQRDLETKRFEYAQAAIPEYWIVDPMKKEITVLTLAGDHYEVVGVFESGSRAISVLLAGFGVDVSEVFAAK